MTPIYLLRVDFCAASVNKVRLTLSLVDFLRTAVLVPFPSNHAGLIIRFSDSVCSLPAFTSFETLPPSGVCGFLVERIIVSLIFARTAAASASSRTFLPFLSLSSSSSSSSETTSTQPVHFDLPFFIGVAFLTAIPFFFTDCIVPGTFFGSLGGAELE